VWEHALSHHTFSGTLAVITQDFLLQVELKEKLKHYEDRDPTVLKALGEKVNFAIEHACRWGLNLSSVR
jgi:hypothetical protein